MSYRINSSGVLISYTIATYSGLSNLVGRRILWIVCHALICVDNGFSFDHDRQNDPIDPWYLSSDWKIQWASLSLIHIDYLLLNRQVSASAVVPCYPDKISLWGNIKGTSDCHAHDHRIELRFTHLWSIDEWRERNLRTHHIIIRADQPFSFVRARR